MFSIEGKTCAFCSKRPAETAYSDEGFVAANHGMWTPACMVCVLQRQIAHCEEQVARLPKLQEELRKLLELEG